MYSRQLGLPQPASLRPGPTTGILSTLKHRSRVTNLFVCILGLLLCFSLTAHLRMWAATHTSVRWAADRDANGDTSLSAGGQYLETDWEWDWNHTDPRAELRGINHLIVIAGHAIWTGQDPELYEQDDQWLLDSYQKGGKTVRALRSHIQAGVDLALADPTSLLVFSGGQTRANAIDTEAKSYHRFAVAANILPSSYFSRATTEDFARDSFENLLFSAARFYEIVGMYPSKITVVGYGVKEQRFRSLHAPAIRFPASQFHYVGTDLEGPLEAMIQGERENSYLPFTRDLYGCRDPTLLAKRRKRNPFARQHPYATSAPELAELLRFCPPLAPPSLEASSGDMGTVDEYDEEKGQQQLEGVALRVKPWLMLGSLPWDP